MLTRGLHGLEMNLSLEIITVVWLNLMKRIVSQVMKCISQHSLSVSGHLERLVPESRATASFLEFLGIQSPVWLLPSRLNGLTPRVSSRFISLSLEH